MGTRTPYFCVRYTRRCSYISLPTSDIRFAQHNTKRTHAIGVLGTRVSFYAPFSFLFFVSFSFFPFARSLLADPCLCYFWASFFEGFLLKVPTPEKDSSAHASAPCKPFFPPQYTARHQTTNRRRRHRIFASNSCAAQTHRSGTNKRDRDGSRAY